MSTIEQTVMAVASRGAFTRGDVERAISAAGIRSFAEGEIGETLRALEAAGEIVPSGTWVDPKTRRPLFRTGGPARPAARVSQEEGEYRAFASLMGLAEEPVRTVETAGLAPVETRPPGVSVSEEVEYRAFRATLGEVD